MQLLLKDPTSVATCLSPARAVSPLLYALEGIHNKTNNAAMVRVLLRAGADPNWHDPASGEPILVSFLRHVTDGSPPDILRHIFRGKKGDSLGSFRDLQNELVDSAMALISSGADPNTMMEDGVSLLYYAIRHNWAKVALHLLDNGADPDGARRTWSGIVLSVVNWQRALISSDEKIMWDKIDRLLGSGDIVNGKLG